MSVRRRMRNASPLWNDASSIRRQVFFLGIALCAIGATARGQDPARARVDSIAVRLERAEERVKLLEQQLAAESESAVRTRSRIALEVRGRVLVNAFSNDSRVNGTDNPQFVRPDDPGDPHPQGIGMQIRQTSLGIALTVAQVWGANFVGDLDVDFGGGQLPSSGGRTFPLMRIRTARASLRWPHAELLLGQDSPLIASVNPAGLAALGTPGFAAAGNLWLWLPQARATIETGGSIRLGIQGAVLAPGTGAAAGTFEVPDFDVAERSKRPFLEGRVRVRWGSDDTAAELGLGGHVGWFATSANVRSRGSAIAVSAAIPLARWVEIRAEAYDGSGTRALGGGGVGQLFGLDGVLVRSRGGWGQVNLLPNPTLVVGAGYGLDDPNDADLPTGATAGARLKNEAVSAHAEWRPAGPLVFGIEFRHLRTTYALKTFANTHVNLAFGFEF